MIANKKIIITGASSGIGKAILKLLAKEKSNIIVAAARNMGKLENPGENVFTFNCDLSTKEGVDALFDFAAEKIGYADLFFCNAGAPYYEKFDYENWDRVEKIFRLNAISHIYTYSKYVRQLGGRKGRLVYTVSAMGEMAIPGYSLYSSTKFAMKGFQEAIRHELPKNVKLTCVYPVSTNTNFFNVAAEGKKMSKPFPVQEPEDVAEETVKGVEHGKSHIYPCKVFRPSKALMTVVPPVKLTYMAIERGRLKKYLKLKEGK